MRQQRSFRGVLLVTTTIISAHVLGLPPEPEYFTRLLGLWGGGGLVVIAQPDFDPERPLSTLLLGTTATTAASGGIVHYANATLAGEGAVQA